MTDEARPFPASAPRRGDMLSPISAVADPAKSQPRTASAKDRLVASRQRIRDQLMAIACPAPKPSFFSRPGSWEDKVKGVLLDLPGVASATDVVHGWWINHPARQAGLVAGKVSSTLVQPVVRDYPRSMLALAGALGASFVVLRPWRWLLRPRVLLSVATQIASSTLKKPGKTPWLSVLAAMARSR